MAEQIPYQYIQNNQIYQIPNNYATQPNVLYGMPTQYQYYNTKSTIIKQPKIVKGQKKNQWWNCFSDDVNEDEFKQPVQFYQPQPVQQPQLPIYYNYQVLSQKYIPKAPITYIK